MLGTKIIEVKNSKFNGELKVVKTIGLGTYIQAGGLTQSGGIVESIWKSTLNQIKDHDIENILILGLGGGSVAKLSKKIWPEAKITGVDIDPVIVELGRKYLGISEINIKIQDALSFIKSSKKKKYDLILVDLYQGDNFPEKFEENSFISKVKTLLSKEGIVIFNRLYYGDKRPMAVKFGLKLQKNFKNVEYFYPQANLMFISFVS